MTKVIQVLMQEYKSTVMTKAFVLGAVIFPLVFYTLIIIIPNVIDSEPPQLKGTLAVYDANTASRAFDAIEEQLNPEMIQAQKNELEQLRDPDNSDSDAQRQEMVEQARSAGGEAAVIAMELFGGGNPFLDQPVPDVTLEFADLESEETLDDLRERMQALIRAGDLLGYLEIKEGGSQAMERGGVTLYTGPGLHAENQSALRRAVRQGIVESRWSHAVAYAADMMNMMPPSIELKTVTETGEAKSIGEAMFLVPLAFMMLLWISTFTGGQYLLMSTVEEKSSRVMEVMLSAVSSMQMMTGKILGQGAVAATMLAIYLTVSLLALDKYNLLHLIEFRDVIIFIPYFIMAFLIVACMMASVGSAVNDVREASAMMTPAMMVLIIPFLVMMPVIQAPNSMLAQVLSFIPPFTPFIMAMRLGSNQDIAMWQVGATLVIGFASVYVLMKAAAKVFRIGVLMYGKPPNFKTLVKWVWQA
ncbi:MAG: ABC transporter permease [Planctomycetes bacterium]|nr:ABC transporter permease [Planctomycetota bacterium]NOG55374.1 ABC transporter permease [Planctomycetota bacterium]